MRTTTTTALGLAIALSLVAACGDDNDDETASATAAPAASAPTASAAEAPAPGPALGAAFCNALVDLDAAAATVPIEEPAAFVAAVPTLQPLVDAVAAAAPPTLAADATAMKTAFGEAVTAGTAEPLFAATPAIDAIELGGFDGCGFQQVPITATEYHFEGLAPTLQAGATSFKLTNAGQEPHVLVLVRKRAGVSESFQEILAAGAEGGEESVAGLVEDVTSGAFAPPGGVSAITTELTPGQYLLLCPIPVTNAAGEEGPPHFVQGMSHEFTVE